MANKEKVICGIQQVGIGVKNAEESRLWYKDVFGFDLKMFEDEGVAEKMLPYTGGKPQPRYATLLLNLQGGCGFEVWEPRGRELNYPEALPKFGDYGIFACKIKSADVKAAYEMMKEKGVNLLTEVSCNPAGVEHFFVMDPWNNIFDVEQDGYVFLNEEKLTGGGGGVIIGVSNMDKSIEFYSSILDYDQIEYDVTKTFDDFKGVDGGQYKMRRVMLSRSKALEGPLCGIMGTSQIELVERIAKVGAHKAKKIFEGRLWGDPGFIHLCFDIRNMECIRTEAKKLGQDFVCDGGRDFKMGDANGHFTYIEDPDGTLIEFVETFRIPILKKFGIYLNLENKNDYKPLPGWLLKCLRFMK